MIHICLADNYPVVHYGLKSYFKDHSSINIEANVTTFLKLKEILSEQNIDILVFDLDLSGLSSIYEIKSLIKAYPTTKFIVFSNYAETLYAPNAIKAGVYGYVHKSSSLENLENVIEQVNQGTIVLNENLTKKLEAIAKQNKSERLYRKLSNREIEVLRYLSDGKKNNEIASILSLNEKTISTYKLRLLQKLSVTNLVDLVNKAKTLEIV